MSTALVVVTIIAVLFAWAWRDLRKDTAQIDAIFAGREALSPQASYERFFRASGAPVVLVRDVIAILEQEFGVELSRLRPDDGFSTHLQPFFARDDMVDVSIVKSLEAHFHVKISDAEAQSMLTVRVVVRMIHDKHILAACEAAG